MTVITEEESPHTRTTIFNPHKISMHSAKVKVKVNGEVKDKNGEGKVKILVTVAYVLNRKT